MKRKRKRNPVIDLTYRTERPGRATKKLIIQQAQRMVGDRVVVWLPREQKWKRAYLIGINPGADTFRIRWTSTRDARTLRGIWRLHTPSLFRGGNNLLRADDESATVPEPPNPKVRGGLMATAKKRPANKRVAKPKAAARAAREVAEQEEPEANGAKRKADKLAGLSEARLRNIAKLIHRERTKSPATSWDDIKELISDKYDWALPGSMTGRRILRDYLPDQAEEAIIQQTRTEAKPKKKVSSKKAKEIEEELEDEEEELDEEELEEEYEEELEADEDEDEDEDEEDEEEEPEPVVAKRAPKRTAKKVAVKRGRGTKS